MESSKLKNNGGYCTVCYEDFNEAKKTGDKIGMPMSLSCGHEFCAGCWKGFLSEKINSEGRFCLNTYCQ